MTTIPEPITENDLHAYADRQLAPERLAEVEAWLEQHPDTADEVALWQRQNEALTALFPEVSPGLTPERLNPRLLASRPRGVTLNWAQMAAAAVVVLAIGTGAGWALREFERPPERESLIALAVSAHSLYVNENRHAVEVSASERDHLVSWLSNRVERPITTPDLSAEGFTLVGGRLLPGDYDGDNGPSAQLMYENAANERVTVYVTAALPNEGTTSEFTTRDDLEAFYWSNDRITCTVVGSLPEAEMKSVAKKIYTQMTWRPDGSSGWQT
jgi:anti-sigma factor RsiW